MMFRELRESIQSEEDAATAITISRTGGLKVKGLTTGGTEPHRGKAITTKGTKVHEGKSGFMLAFSN